MNGDSAIYSSEPWTFQNDSSNGKVWYTKKGDNVYGISLGWPDNDILRVSSPEVREGTTRIQMIGYQGHDLEYTGNFEKGNINSYFHSLFHYQDGMKCCY